MAELAVSFLLEQLSTVLREESALLGGVRNEIEHIRDELGQMKGFLRKAEAIVESNPELQEWVSQVRDVAYDAEDVLDEFMMRFGRSYGDGFLGRVQKLYGSIKNMKARHQIANQTHGIKKRILNISEAHKRYQNEHGVIEQGSSSSVVHQNTWNDSRGDALLLKEEDLVGIEKPKKKLIDMLSKSDSQLQVITVVGMGGLGKSTLVKKVYDDLSVKNRFKHHAWITVSQTFKIETLLKQAIQQLFTENQPAGLEIMDITSLKKLLHDFLHQENYILVLDDIWKTTDWDAIRIALPKSNRGSRIMITSRTIEVGQAAKSDIAGDIYSLEPLTKEESWTLFCKKAFRDISCPPHLMELSKTILERCVGLPLAIVVISGILARKSHRLEEWDLFNRSLSAELAHNDQLDNMTKILSLSYYDLPEHLRICFLYLSILPEDDTIGKNRLVRLWIAEGFVQKKKGMTIDEVAEGYLNELINRSLIQVAETTTDGRVRTCRVHDIIHQIILFKAREQNIVVVYSEPGTHLVEKVRRLALHCSIDNTQVSIGSLKYLRSLLILKNMSMDSSSMPFIFKLLSDGLRLQKVLDLPFAPLETIPDEIFKLLHLKYLSLRSTNVQMVPKSIGKLQRLEVLNLKWTNVTELPVEILKLQQLRHLLVGMVYSGFKAPKKIGNLQSLQTLCYVRADQIGILNEIGKLTQLRKLGITNLKKEDGKEFCSALEKLANLRSLHIVADEEDVIDLQYSLSSTPQFLRSIELWAQMEKVPQWIRSLRGLTRIELCETRFKEDPLELFQDLPGLLELQLKGAYGWEELCFKAGAFKVLKVLAIGRSEELKRVRMEKGAMPFLEKLFFFTCDSLKELPTGLEHMINLQYLQFLDMSDEFLKMIEDMKNQSGGIKPFSHIPRVVLYDSFDKKRTFSMGTELVL